MSRRYQYHAPWEIEPRPTASGSQNLISLSGATLTGVKRPCRGCGMGVLPEFPVSQRAPVAIMPVAMPIFRSWPPSNTVAQPPPIGGPVGSPVVPVSGHVPVSPTPSPTVAVSADQTAPQLTQPGTVLDSTGASVTTASDIGTWLSGSTLITGIPNWGIAGAAALAALWMFMGKSGRR